MKREWVKIDGRSGVIIARRSSSDGSVPAGYVLCPDDVPFDWALDYYRTREGDFARRPVIAGCDPLSMPGFDVTVRDLPKGTELNVLDKVSHVWLGSVYEEGGVIRVELPEPGIYVLEWEPPAPYKPLSQLVVSEALP